MGKLITPRLKQALIKKPYVYFFPLFVILFIVLNIILNDAFILLPHLSSYNLFIVVPYTILNITIAFFFALNSNLFILKIKELETLVKGKLHKEGSTFALGSLLGLVVGVCPGCIAGLLPAILGFLGVGSAITHPFLGIEVQIISLILLVYASYRLSQPVSCRITPEKKSTKK